MHAIVAWGTTALTVGLLTAAIAFSATPGSGATELPPSTVLFALQFVPLAVVGALIVARRPTHRIGWLLVGIGLLFALGGASATVARYFYVSAPAVGGALVVASNQLFKLVFCGGALLLLLFPTGQLPSRRWGWLPVALATVVLIAIAADVVTPGPVIDYLVTQPPRNPFGADPLTSLVRAIDRIGFAVFAVLAAAAAVSLVSRYRHAVTEERLQLKWFALAAGVWATTLVADGVFRVMFAGPTWPELPFQIGYSVGTMAMAVGIGVAILRHRLFDVDVVIGRTLAYALLVAVISCFYVGAVAGLGALFVLNSSSQLIVAVVATAVVAVAFQPVRGQMERLGRRLVYGSRAGPYEVLANFTRGLEGSPAAEELLPTMAAMLAKGTGCDAATVWVCQQGRATPVAMWPGPQTTPPGAATRSVPVLQAGEQLGELSVMRRSGERLSPTEEDLMDSLALQAGLVLRNEHLQQQLRDRLEELRASRQRLVSIQDEERRRLERDLHDGAQQELVAMRMKLGLASAAAGSDPTSVVPLLEELQHDLGVALNSLRDLARGVYPPLLESEGLKAALSARARSLPFAVDIRCDTRRYPREVEGAIYFCCAEALQNIVKHAEAKHASVGVRTQDDAVCFEVRDNGRGGLVDGTGVGKSGVRHIRDRIEALGGTVDFETTVGGGSLVTGYVPLT
ncbi:MAG: GAF domain-containing sensor histidine kinase [Chloroflexi bacterium]|nr:GAF domain-containing sensor histidine kinase [Chloroflexota bacterium]